MDDNRAKSLKQGKQAKNPAKSQKTQTTFDLLQPADGDNYFIFVPKGHPRAKEIRAFFEQMRGEKTILVGRNIRFDKDKNRGILIDDMLVPFRSSSFRSLVARILLEHLPGERVSWDQVREHKIMAFTDASSKLTKKERASFKRKITDAVDAINEKIQQVLNTNDILFSRDDNQIFRYFIRNF
jgi:hypothetical protein